MRNVFKALLANFLGYKTSRKIIVFESDDWGSNRMPSINALATLKTKGYELNHLKFATLDTLETKDDLEALANVIIQNSMNNTIPIFTTNMVMGNPDYKKIKDSSLTEYYHMDLKESYEYYLGVDLKNTWHQAIKEKIFSPQFHAREHLNTRLWLKDLKVGNDSVVDGFNNEFYGMINGTSSKWQNNYLMAYYAESIDELRKVEDITSEGLRKFQAYFGYAAKSFVACNYVYPKELEKILAKMGIKSIQCQKGYIMPVPAKKGKKIRRYRYTGEKNKFGQYYTVRNVQFEPAMNQSIDWIDKVLREIEKAFFWKKPAIISTHRINYVSNLNQSNRDLSLNKLNLLLSSIKRKFPEAEFASSLDLLKIIKDEEEA